MRNETEARDEVVAPSDGADVIRKEEAALETLRYMVVDPDGVVTTFRSETDDQLTLFQEIVGGSIEFVPSVFEDVSFYIHEEGKIFNLPLNAVATEIAKETIMPGDYIAGPMIIVGFDPETGDNCSLREDMRIEQFISIKN